MSRKKLFVLFLLINGILFSQEKNSLGLNTGLTYSDFRGNDFFDNYEYGFDFLIGISFDYKIKDRLFISTDVNYERKSANDFYEASAIGPGGTITVIGIPIGEYPPENPPDKPKLKFQTRFEYISIPILLKYFVCENNDFYVNGGPYLGYLLNIKNIDDGEESELDFNNEFEKIDLGLTIGIGYNLDLNQKSYLNFELRNNFGLTNIESNNNDLFDRTKANSLNLIIGWNFYL